MAYIKETFDKKYENQKKLESNTSNFFITNSNEWVFLIHKFIDEDIDHSMLQLPVYKKVKSVNYYLILVYIIEGFKFAFVDIWHKQ